MTHEGKKYLRPITGWKYAEDGNPAPLGFVDVYCVLVAFGVTCPAVAHAVKKLLCAGQRGKGDTLADLTGAKAAIERAVQLEQQRKAVVEEP